MTSKTVTLLAGDGVKFVVLKKIALMNLTVAEVMDEFEGEPVPLPPVTSHTLSKIIEYCTHHVADPVKTNETPTKDSYEISEWDQAFFNVPLAEKFELIMAASFMDNDPLFNLGCKLVGKMFVNKKPKEVREILQITAPFTEAMRAQTKKDNPWCEDA
jgi:S-phase kinase-associated protein 1